MTLYIYLLIFVLFYVSSLRYDVHMFQQNSYRVSRYLRWRKGTCLKADLHSLLLIPACFIPNELVRSLCITAFVIFAEELIRSISKNDHKTPLVYTARVKRLMVCDILVNAALICAGYFLLPEEYIVAMLALLWFASPLVMLLSNLIITPLEMAITQWYIADARKILASKKDLIIIGVTGSYGKTSTKNYLYRMLSEQYNVLVTPGNYNTLLGVVRTVREQLRPQHQIFIVEMGAKQSGDIREICDLVHPSIGIVTSVGEAHLETFKSVENIQRTKFELVDSLPSDGLAVVNFDSRSIRDYKFSSHARAVSYAIDNKADVVAENVSYNSSGVAFTLSIGGDQVQFSSPLLGGGNVLNLTAGIIVAEHLGVSTVKIARALKQLQPVEHRLSISRAGGLTILDDAYNSNPTGAKMALEVLRNFDRVEGASRIIITPGFVEMGASQYAANFELGRQIASSVDYAVVVNLHNREAIHSGLREGGMSEDKIYLAASLATAREHLATRLKVGDVVLYENDLPDSFK